MKRKSLKRECYPIRPVSDIKDLIEQSVALYSEQSAYLVKDVPGGKYKPVLYSKVKEDMDCLGTAFLDLGLYGKRIVVVGENRYEWIQTYLATVCGVGVIVPIERELHVKEIQHLLERSGASAIVFSGKMEETILEAIKDMDNIQIRISMDQAKPEYNIYSLKELMAKGKQLIESGKRDYIDGEINPDVMNILLFTSGTTGMSKGVMLSHKNIVSNVMQMSMYVNVQGWIGLSVLPMHHTYEMTCHIMTAFYQGCCVAICEGLKYIQKNMVESHANVMLGVPLIFESMYKKVWKQAEKSGKSDKLQRGIRLSKKLNLYNKRIVRRMFREIHDNLGGEMKLFISGAAAIDPQVVEDFNAIGLKMIQGYGMTECSPIIAVNKDRYSKHSSVGLPLPKTEVKIKDPDDSGVGEIMCRGDSVMLGYLDDPKETERVLKDGWLYTGDYGYLDQDGFLYITGRKKNVIVTKNGKNIFPEEVEFYLGKSDFVAECIVYGKQDPKGEMLVCAQIFPDYSNIEEKYGTLSHTELKKLLKEEIDKANDQMPLYKRIKRFDIRDSEFEKTTTKKIKRYKVEY